MLKTFQNVHDKIILYARAYMKSDYKFHLPKHYGQPNFRMKCEMCTCEEYIPAPYRGGDEADDFRFTEIRMDAAIIIEF